MNNSVKITLSMIVKNEEKYLRECLDSVKDIVDEIIIVDTGSVDNTINIAKEYRAKVYRYNWINDFSAARNFALSKSSGRWILYMDADERLSKESIAELNKTTENNKLLGCRCIVNNLDDHNGKRNYMRYTRLFHNHSKIKFSGAVHEQIDDSLIENGYEIIDTGIEILHTGYNLPEEKLREKGLRNLEILKREYEKNNSSYNTFQLANTFSLIKDYEDAYKYYLLSVKADNLKPEYKAHAYLFLCDYELRKHRIAEAVNFLERGLNNDYSNTLLHLLASDIYFRINKKEKALEHCCKALEENKKTISLKSKSSFGVILKAELIISKGIYYSLLSADSTKLKFFINEFKKENNKQAVFIESFIKNKIFSAAEKDEVLKIVTADNLDLFLLIMENYKEKKTALEILLLLNDRFSNNSKFLKTLGLLYFENKLYNEAIKEYEESLLQKEKDPASVFYLISALIESNQIDKIPDLLLFAENEFGNIPEFNSSFENLKQKLSEIFNGQTLLKH